MPTAMRVSSFSTSLAVWLKLMEVLDSVFSFLDLDILSSTFVIRRKYDKKKSILQGCRRTHGGVEARCSQEGKA